MTPNTAAWLTLAPLDRHRERGGLAIRLFVAFVLIYGVTPHVTDANVMQGFEDFLRARTVPLPGLAARVCVYAEFGCGVLIGLGAATRWAAAVMVINFLAAIAIAHLDAPFMRNVAPLSMLAGSVFLLVSGAGTPSVDAWLTSAGSANPQRT